MRISAFFGEFSLFSENFCIRGVSDWSKLKKSSFKYWKLFLECFSMIPTKNLKNLFWNFWVHQFFSKKKVSPKKEPKKLKIFKIFWQPEKNCESWRNWWVVHTFSKKNQWNEKLSSSRDHRKYYFFHKRENLLRNWFLFFWRQFSFFGENSPKKALTLTVEVVSFQTSKGNEHFIP